MINFAANLLLIGFLIVHVLLLIYFPIIGLILIGMLGLVSSYVPK